MFFDSDLVPYLFGPVTPILLCISKNILLNKKNIEIFTGFFTDGEEVHNNNNKSFFFKLRTTELAKDTKIVVNFLQNSNVSFFGKKI